MSTNPARILVCDDDPRTCQMLQKVLLAEGYEVDVANDGPSALRHVARHPYNVAILDYRMPKMDGVELFRRIHKQQPQVVGVFLTGYATIDTVFPAIDVGIQRVLGKPLDVDELLEVLKDLRHDRVGV